MMRIPRRYRIAAVIIAVLLAVFWMFRPRPLTAVFLAVGDGLCVVMETPSGHTVMIDCGNQNTEDEGRQAAMTAERCLSRMGKSKIDVLFITHPHNDHFSGLPILLRRKPVKNIMIPYNQSAGDYGYGRVLDLGRSYGAEITTLAAGAKIPLGGGCAAKVYSPVRRHENDNDNSLIMKITAGKRSILITGDAEKTAEEEVLAERADINSDVLQVGHHGSASSTSEDFLRAAAPQYAVISCKGGGRFKFPSPETLRVLDKCHVKTYITGYDGAVEVKLTLTGVKVKTYTSK